MVDVVSLVMAFIAIIPVGTIFFLAYGRYDGTFRDNVVFLYFMGGLGVGAVLGVFTLFALNLGAFLTLLSLALFYPIALVAAINRRKWQGERHAVFNGGALGLGASLMLAFTLLFRYNRELDASIVGRSILLSLGLAALFFGMGLMAGNAVRLKRQFRVSLLGTAILVPPIVILLEYLKGEQAWLWVVLLAAYGSILAVAIERKLLLEGVEPDMRKKMRRRSRKATP